MFSKKQGLLRHNRESAADETGRRSVIASVLLLVVLFEGISRFMYKAIDIDSRGPNLGTYLESRVHLMA